MRESLIIAKNNLSQNIRKTSSIPISSFFKSKLTSFSSQKRLPTSKHFFFRKDILNFNNQDNVVNQDYNQNFNQDNMIVNNIRQNMEDWNLDSKLKRIMLEVSNNLEGDYLNFYFNSNAQNRIIEEAILKLYDEFGSEYLNPLNDQSISDLCMSALKIIIERRNSGN